MKRRLLLAGCFFAFIFSCAAENARNWSEIRLGTNPSVSPDGSFFAFEWKDRVWLAPTEGGTAVPLGDGMSADTRPFLSPDGKHVAFLSDRWGTLQLFEAELDEERLVASGVRQVTFHTEGLYPWGYTPDGKEMLALARDGRQIYVEVKTVPEIVPAVKKVFEGQTNATPKNALFITFNEATCKALKAAMPDYRVYWLVSPKKGTAFATADGIVAKLMELGVDGVDCRYKPDIVTAEYVKAIRGAGYEFHAWTIDDLPNMREAFKRGVQTVTTNCAKKLLDEYRESAK